jgi:long-chain acyl-CoA synthetase
MSVILRDKLDIDPNIIPRDPIKQNKLILENRKKLSDYTNSKDVFDDIHDEIERLNQRFSNPEQIKKFSILPRDFSIDDGELTPTLKIRRKQISENWSKTIESMYNE